MVRELAEAQRRTEEQRERLGMPVERLAEQVGALVSWQRGEAGRREVERSEREIVRQAPVLFNGGRGGTPEDASVRQWLTEQLQTRLEDLLWWKGGQVAVVEASLQVNGVDVARAATLARVAQPAACQPP